MAHVQLASKVIYNIIPESMPEKKEICKEKRPLSQEAL
jgi:hypothetical protein